MNARQLKIAIVTTDNPDRASGCQAPAGKVLGCSLPVDSELTAQRWEWRCNVNVSELREVVDSYQELGFEVRLDRLDLDSLSENCMGCKEALARLHALFVRRK